jgi:predicted secreted Zn-dependent protease
VKYSELLKEYIIEIAKTRQVNKLESYLLNTILKDENSAERKFYKEIGVNYISIMKNAVKILDAFNECKELVATINSLITLYS